MLQSEVAQVAEQAAKNTEIIAPKPILKWAGGKTQLLGELLPKVPSSYNRYIEPFVGGGAMFFALQPENGLIADSNPELINMYRQVSGNVEAVIRQLETYQNTKDMFYLVRGVDWEAMMPSEAAARTIYLNKTCFNGLYRVNKRGQFNVPYGRYSNPNYGDAGNDYVFFTYNRKLILDIDDLDDLQDEGKGNRIDAYFLQLKDSTRLDSNVPNKFIEFSNNLISGTTPEHYNDEVNSNITLFNDLVKKLVLKAKFYIHFYYFSRVGKAQLESATDLNGRFETLKSIFSRVDFIEKEYIRVLRKQKGY